MNAADSVNLRERVASELDAARRRSLLILEPFDDDDLARQHSPLMSPLAWDLAHVGNYEEQWLLRAPTAGSATVRPDLDSLYDAFLHARADRPSLPLLAPGAARQYVAAVRGRVLDLLEAVELDSADPLLADAFVYGMVIQHEHQHDETMLATCQLMGDRAPWPLSTSPTPPGGPIGAVEVAIPAGRHLIGADENPWVLDNERPRHAVDLNAFAIDTAPTTCGAFLAFVDSGGYSDPSWWSPEGWAWVQDESAEAPSSWRHDGPGSWSVLRFGDYIDLPTEEPVQHVCFYEAEAFARFAGRRLPTEAEWEVAASGADVADANLGQAHAGPAPVGAYPCGVSKWGAHQMLGDVWEWTASDFDPYPGFGAFPYREYSEVFWGQGLKVLRGGSWATHESCARITFRNWDLPLRRQIFSGFRTARDA